MRALEVCSGIGGLALGLELAGWEIAGLCEADPRCRAELALHWPQVPILADLGAITDEDLDAVGPVDLLAGGIPCQPWSNAGKRRGRHDERDLWPAFLALAERVGARCLLVENVPGLASDTGGADRIAADLEARGYVWWACRLRAADVGAPHLRDRFWICAMADRDGAGPLLTQQQAGWDTLQPGLELQPHAERCGRPDRALGHSDGRAAQRAGGPGELPGALGAAPGAGLTAAGRQPGAAGADRAAPLGDPEAFRRQGRDVGEDGAGPAEPERSGPWSDAGALGDAQHHRCQGRQQDGPRPSAALPSGPWADAVAITCRDGKTRLVPAPELALQSLADGLPEALAERWPLAPAEPGRVARLRAIGNAVVPLQAYVPARALLEVALAGANT